LGRNHEYDIKNLKVQCSPFWIFLPKWKSGIELLQTWIDFGNYLDKCIEDRYFSMTSAYQRTVGASGYSNLFDWYSASGRPLRFEDLALEIRQQIYEYAIGDDIYPRVDNMLGVPSVCLSKGWIPQAPFRQLEGTHHQNEEVAPPDLTLSYLNKQIHVEFMDMVWRSPRMSFPDPSLLRDVANIKQALPTCALRRIGLNFSNMEYIRFFGVNVVVHSLAPFTYQWIPSGVAAAQFLSNGQLPNLAELDIKFRSARWLPWMGLRSAAHFFEPLSLCQRDITETILALALDYVYHIDNVSLEGDIKEITKGEFRRALQKKRKDPTYEPDWVVKITGQIYSHGKSTSLRQQRTLLRLSRNARCVCRVPCSLLNPLS
jgi:hypothetical protein